MHWNEARERLAFGGLTAHAHLIAKRAIGVADISPSELRDFTDAKTGAPREQHSNRISFRGAPELLSNMLEHFHFGDRVKGFSGSVHGVSSFKDEASIGGKDSGEIHRIDSIESSFWDTWRRACFKLTQCRFWHVVLSQIGTVRKVLKDLLQYQRLRFGLILSRTNRPKSYIPRRLRHVANLQNSLEFTFVSMCIYYERSE